MKKFLIGTGLLLLIGAGCGSSSENAAEQAKRDALKARTSELAAEQQAPAAAASKTSGSPDGLYCNKSSEKLCRDFSFTNLTVTEKIILSSETLTETYKMKKISDTKYSYTGTQINAAYFVEIMPDGSIEIKSVTTGQYGGTLTTQWVRK